MTVVVSNSDDYGVLSNNGLNATLAVSESNGSGVMVSPLRSPCNIFVIHVEHSFIGRLI
jgi:hypothetical protein